MIEIIARLKQWGRSFGIVVPMEKIKEEGLIENEALEITIRKKKNPLRETFGTFKFKRPIKKILDESDREAWDE